MKSYQDDDTNKLKPNPWQKKKFLLNLEFPSLRLGTQFKAPNLLETQFSLVMKQCTKLPCIPNMVEKPHLDKPYGPLEPIILSI
jgi:hypothetical protein